MNHAEDVAKSTKDMNRVIFELYLKFVLPATGQLRHLYNILKFLEISCLRLYKPEIVEERNKDWKSWLCEFTDYKKVEHKKALH
jgi:hypothetical protein